jgi:hypothetical protein
LFPKQGSAILIGVKRLLPLLLLLGSCRGTVPPRSAPPEQAISAILVGCRLVLPTGETRNGQIAINFESEGGRHGEKYRVPVRGGEYYLYLVEPGDYKIMPTRSWLGFHQLDMTLTIEGRRYRLPFPRELLRQKTYEIRPSKIVSMGILEAKVMPALPGQKPTVRVRLDDSVQARRTVVQELIRDMMNPRRSTDQRESAIAWSRALQNNLLDLLAEEDPRQMYRPAAPR